MRLICSTRFPDSALDLEIDPLGRWVFASNRSEIRMWPMPDLSKPPMHTWPVDELLGKLRSLTNYRISEDPGTARGWKLEPGPS